MPATVLKIDPLAPCPAALRQAAQVLAAGGVAAFPTETYYGLAADHANPAALEKLAMAKGREESKPFALILARPGEAHLLANCPDRARPLMAAHWPGPLTLVLPARPGLSKRLLGPGDMVGMRLSPHPVAAGLAAALGRAVTATSANLAGRPPVARAGDLAPELLQRIELVLDAGPTAGGPASTVAAVSPQGQITILRPGAVEL